LPEAQHQVERIADGIDRAHAEVEVAFDIGIQATELRYHVGQEQLRQAGGQRNAQPPLGLGGHVLQLLVRHARFLDDMAAALEIQGAGFGQVDAAGAAVEQAHAQAALQLADTARQRGGGDVEGFGRVAEILALGHFNEERDIVELDIHLGPLFLCRRRVGAPAACARCESRHDKWREHTSCLIIIPLME